MLCHLPSLPLDFCFFKLAKVRQWSAMVAFIIFVKILQNAVGQLSFDHTKKTST